MKYCQKCGKELLDEAVICVGCGCQVQEIIKKEGKEETSGLMTAAMICAFLIPIVGFVLGIIGCRNYTTQTYKNCCASAIAISVIVWVISLFAFMIINTI